MHPKAMLSVDEDACLELQVKTVRYFKSVESQAQDDIPESKVAAAPSTEILVPRVAALKDSKVHNLPLSPTSPTDAEFKEASMSVVTNGLGETDDDLIPDSMESRIPTPPSSPALVERISGLVPGELAFDAMGTRVAVA
jgi:glucosamine-6-phosphate deaminase